MKTDVFTFMWLIESNVCLQDFLLASKMFIVCEYVPQSALQLLRGGQGALRTPDQASHPPGGVLLLKSRHNHVLLVCIACLTVSHPEKEKWDVPRLYMTEGCNTRAVHLQHIAISKQ